jgi:hypothetical protein
MLTEWSPDQAQLLDRQYAGDVQVVHQRQVLPLGLKAGDDLSRVDARLDRLQGDRSMNRFLLFGAVDDTHAALAD